MSLIWIAEFCFVQPQSVFGTRSVRNIFRRLDVIFLSPGTNSSLKTIFQTKDNLSNDALNSSDGSDKKSLPNSHQMLFFWINSYSVLWFDNCFVLPILLWSRTLERFPSTLLQLGIRFCDRNCWRRSVFGLTNLKWVQNNVKWNVTMWSAPVQLFYWWRMYCRILVKRSRRNGDRQ